MWLVIKHEGNGELTDTTSYRPRQLCLRSPLELGESLGRTKDTQLLSICLHPEKPSTHDSSSLSFGIPVAQVSCLPRLCKLDARQLIKDFDNLPYKSLQRVPICTYFVIPLTWQWLSLRHPPNLAVIRGNYFLYLAPKR